MDGLTKRCTGCRRVLPITDFHWASKKLGRRRGDCKWCRGVVNAHHYAQNIEYYRGVRRRWYLAHAKEHSERVLRGRDKVKARERQARRRVGGIMQVNYAELLARHGMVCHLCGEAIRAPGELEFDHVIPVGLGGAHSAENLRPSHRRCNRRKGGRLQAGAPK